MILLGLKGPTGSGRDRIAKHLVTAHNWVQYRMVGPAREMLELIGLLPEQFLPGEREAPLFHSSVAGIEKSLVEWGVAQWPDLWRAMASREIHTFAPLGFPGIVISDLQSEEDCDWVRRNGGSVWHTQSIIPEVDGKGVINTDVKYHLDDEQMLLSNPGQDVGPLVDNVLKDLLARYVA